MISLSRYVLSHCQSKLIVSWNPWLTSLLRLYRKACYVNKPRGPVSTCILSVLFFLPFCRFRGNNRFEGERFPTEEVVIVVSYCVTSIVLKSKQPLSICSTLKHGTFSTKIFLLHFFFIATNITSPKTILPFHFSPKPTAEGETKRQQTKQL